MIWLNIAVIALLLALNGFFVAVEFAVVASRTTRLDASPNASGRNYEIVRRWLEQPSARDRLIAASQLGITAVSLALGAIGEKTFERLITPIFSEVGLPATLSILQEMLPFLPLALSLIVVTSLHVVLGEQMPKVAVLRAPEQFILKTAPAMHLFTTIFKWPINMLDWATRKLLYWLGLPNASLHSSLLSLEEIKQMVTGPSAEAAIEKPGRDMLSAVIDFGELIVRQVAIPRTELVAVEASTPLPEALAVLMKHGLTKLPVFENSVDHIVGIVHLRDMVPALQLPDLNARLVGQLAREALFVPETISVNRLLHDFRARGTHVAIVLDEFGGTAGLVTLEDVLEEIVGEVRDPFEASNAPAIQVLPDGTALVDGLTEIEDLNAGLKLNLENSDYDTAAGYVLGLLGRIPKEGDQIEDRRHRLTFRVTQMDRLRIAQISLKPSGEAASTPKKESAS